MKSFRIIYTKLLIALGSFIFLVDGNLLLASEVENAPQSEKSIEGKTLVLKIQGFIKEYKKTVTGFIATLVIGVMAWIAYIIYKRSKKGKGSNQEQNQSKQREKFDIKNQIEEVVTGLGKGKIETDEVLPQNVQQQFEEGGKITHISKEATRYATKRVAELLKNSNGKKLSGIEVHYLLAYGIKLWLDNLGQHEDTVILERLKGSCEAEVFVSRLNIIDQSQQNSRWNDLKNGSIYSYIRIKIEELKYEGTPKANKYIEAINNRMSDLLTPLGFREDEIKGLYVVSTPTFNFQSGEVVDYDENNAIYSDYDVVNYMKAKTQRLLEKHNLTAKEEAQLLGYMISAVFRVNLWRTSEAFLKILKDLFDKKVVFKKETFNPERKVMRVTETANPISIYEYMKFLTERIVVIDTSYEYKVALIIKLIKKLAKEAGVSGEEIEKWIDVPDEKISELEDPRLNRSAFIKASHRVDTLPKSPDNLNNLMVTFDQELKELIKKDKKDEVYKKVKEYIDVLSSAVNTESEDHKENEMNYSVAMALLTQDTIFPYDSNKFLAKLVRLDTYLEGIDKQGYKRVIDLLKTARSKIKE